MVLKHLYIFIMDLSTNQNNCMVHTLNYSMLQLHSQYAHITHFKNICGGKGTIYF